MAIDISEHIISPCQPAKLPKAMLAITFNETSLEDQLAVAATITEKHAQLKCKEVVFPFARGSPIHAPVKAAHVLVKGDAVKNVKGVGKLILDVSEHELSFQPGDTIGILPRNSTKLVARLLTRLGLTTQADSICNVRITADCTENTAHVPEHVPTLTTPRALLSDCLNLKAIPKKKFIAALATHTTDSTERDFLRTLSAKEGTHHYNYLIFGKGLRLMDLLTLCSSCKPPLELLVEQLPRLMPRAYSIASSPLDANKELCIIYSILPQSPGVTTHMMDMYARQHEPLAHSNIVFYIRQPTQFRFTADMVTQRQILVGVGTAIAPFIGFLKYKQHLAGTGETWLYAGAKSAKTMPEHALLTSLQSQGVLNEFRTGYSGEHHAEENYVQALISQDCILFMKFLFHDDTTLFVCTGDYKVSKAIEHSIMSCIVEAFGMNTMTANLLVQALRHQGKYREELWV